MYDRRKTIGYTHRGYRSDISKMTSKRYSAEPTTVRVDMMGSGLNVDKIKDAVSKIKFLDDLSDRAESMLESRIARVVEKKPSLARAVEKVGVGLKLAGSGETFGGVGLNLAGSGSGGKGLKVAGTGYKGKGLKVAGAGLNVAGTGLNVAGTGLVLAGATMPKTVINQPNLKYGMQGTGGKVEELKSQLMKSMPKKKKHKKQKDMGGGFIIAGLAALIAGISAAASAAAATTVIGTATVGSLGAAALTGAAGTAGSIAAKRLLDKKGSGIKSKVLDAIKQTRLKLKDMPQEVQEKIKKGYEELSKSPSKEGLVKFGVKIAPLVKKAFEKKVTKKLGMSGSGLKLAGTGDEFTKVFAKELVKKVG